MAVKVPRNIYEQLEDVRSSGEVNMMDASGVQAVAYDRGHYNLVNWLDDQFVYRPYGVRMAPDAVYLTGVSQGFEPEDEEEE